MTFPRYRWQPAAVDGADSAEAARLAAALNVHPVVARLLCLRGLSDPEAAAAFLRGPADRPDPSLLQDIDSATDAIWAAIAAGKRVLVFGDYDADGLAATALLVAVLQAAGADVSYRIPHRLADGYGLSSDVVSAAAADGFGLLVTVDCGITAVDAAAHAETIGLPLVITDHHQPGPDLPQAAAVVNPHRPDCRYPEKHLSGTGVAYKLAEALVRSAPDPAIGRRLAEVTAAQLDLVALGTVADVMPLTGENRALVKAGLERLSTNPRPGIAALLDKRAGAAHTVTEDDLAFVLAPRLNAAGRLGRLPPEHGVDLLLADADSAGPLAAAMTAENRRRQQLEAELTALALQQVEERLAQAPDAPVLVLSGADWQPGILGTVAARVLEQTGRPVAMLTLDGDEWRGSARGPDGSDWPAWLAACSEWLVRHGGHRQAAGFSVRKDGLEPFAAALTAAVAETAAEWEAPALSVDLWLDSRDMTIALARDLRQLAPFGEGNPEPVFGWKHACVHTSRTVGQDRNHLKLRLHGRTRVPIIDAIGFKLAGAGTKLPRSGTMLDVAFHLRTSDWQGRTQVDLHLRDYAPVATDAPVVAEDTAARAWRLQPAASTGAASRLQPTGTDAAWPTALRKAAPPALWERPLAPGAGLSPVGVVVDRRGTEPVAGRVSESQAVWVCGTVEQTAATAKSLPPTEAVLLGHDGGADAAGTADAAGADCEGPPRHWVVPFGSLPLLPERAQSSPAVLLAPPPTWDSWLAVSSGRSVELAFGPDEAARQQAALAAYAPDRDTLADCFRMLRDALPVRGDLRQADWDDLLAAVPAATWQTAVLVFRELGLIVPDGEALRWQRPTRRLELGDSPTFRLRRAIWEESESLRSYFLAVTADELQAVTAAGERPLAGAG